MTGVYVGSELAIKGAYIIYPPMATSYYKHNIHCDWRFECDDTMIVVVLSVALHPDNAYVKSENCGSKDKMTLRMSSLNHTLCNRGQHQGIFVFIDTKSKLSVDFQSDASGSTQAYRTKVLVYGK